MSTTANATSSLNLIDSQIPQEYQTYYNLTKSTSWTDTIQKPNPLPTGNPREVRVVYTTYTYAGGYYNISQRIYLLSVPENTKLRMKSAQESPTSYGTIYVVPNENDAIAITGTTNTSQITYTRYTTQSQIGPNGVEVAQPAFASYAQGDTPNIGALVGHANFTSSTSGVDIGEYLHNRTFGVWASEPIYSASAGASQLYSFTTLPEPSVNVPNAGYTINNNTDFNKIPYSVSVSNIDDWQGKISLYKYDEVNQNYDLMKTINLPTATYSGTLLDFQIPNSVQKSGVWRVWIDVEKEGQDTVFDFDNFAVVETDQYIADARTTTINGQQYTAQEGRPVTIMITENQTIKALSDYYIRFDNMLNGKIKDVGAEQQENSVYILRATDSQNYQTTIAGQNYELVYYELPKNTAIHLYKNRQEVLSHEGSVIMAVLSGSFSNTSTAYYDFNIGGRYYHVFDSVLYNTNGITNDEMAGYLIGGGDVWEQEYNVDTIQGYTEKMFGMLGDVSSEMVEMSQQLKLFMAFLPPFYWALFGIAILFNLILRILGR